MNRLRLALVALVLLAASGAAAQEPYVVKVGILMSTTDTPLFIADKKGYFREEGLTVKFITFDSGAGMTVPLGSGQLDVGGGALSVGLYNAVQRGIDVRVVADLGSDPPGYGLLSLHGASGPHQKWTLQGPQGPQGAHGRRKLAAEFRCGDP